MSDYTINTRDPAGGSIGLSAEPHPITLQLSGGEGPIATIAPDGTVEVHKEGGIPEAAQQFWQAVGEPLRSANAKLAAAQAEARELKGAISRADEMLARLAKTGAEWEAEARELRAELAQAREEQEKAFASGRRVGLLEAHSAVRRLFTAHYHGDGAQGLLNRCMRLADYLAGLADAALSPAQQPIVGETQGQAAGGWEHDDLPTTEELAEALSVQRQDLPLMVRREWMPARHTVVFIEDREIITTRDELIQCLLATRGQSEGVTADAILSMIAAAPDHSEQDLEMVKEVGE